MEYRIYVWNIYIYICMYLYVWNIYIYIYIYMEYMADHSCVGTNGMHNGTLVSMVIPGGMLVPSIVSFGAILSVSLSNMFIHTM